MNARWVSRVGGQYRLPWWGIAISAANDFRQGYAILNTINVSTRANSAGSVAVLTGPPGTRRFENLEDLDARVDKTFSLFKEKLKVEPAFEVFNLFNGNTVVARQPNQNASTANAIGAVEGPRIARIGVLVTF